jgi:hypothetical protein
MRFLDCTKERGVILRITLKGVKVMHVSVYIDAVARLTQRDGSLCVCVCVCARVCLYVRVRAGV